MNICFLKWDFTEMKITLFHMKAFSRPIGVIDQILFFKIFSSKYLFCSFPASYKTTKEYYRSIKVSPAVIT